MRHIPSRRVEEGQTSQRVATALEPRERVLALLRLYGWNATSFQVLQPGFHYWFDPAGDACVAYVDTGGAWVAAGAPITSPARLAAVTEGFHAAARAAGRRVCFFATEPRFLEHVPMASLSIGEQPVWDPARWDEVLRGSRSLREQLRRARARGVKVREVPAEELADARNPTRKAVERLKARWLASRRMAPMGFLVQLRPHAFASERYAFVAEVEGEVVGFLSVSPVYARDGWFLQDLLRDPEAPNGTAESLVDLAMRSAAAGGRRYVTLGLAPLAGPVRPWLRLARACGRPLFDFEGLRAFKAKFRPDAWVPIHLSYPTPRGGLAAVYDALRAFAQGSLLRFGIATLLRRPRLLVHALAVLLVPWTALLALPATARWFPSVAVQWAWVLFDVGLTVGLFSLVRRWRDSLATVLGGLTAADACLTFAQAVTYNVPLARAPLDWAIIAVAVLAPATASGLLFVSRDLSLPGR
ncbi:phosphatidylglycerol lysyltransferase domain-containing protein [Myxococcus sp. Y35]|uniref:phosphatidylglycerol lysyltransferase domain-containing protein n=1 Tax=Pseudomyxococcus flavus TaxID=3115648 RepID=UPI003CEEA895